MHIPRYWARADGEAPRPDGDRYALTAWGWSSESREAAARMAAERLGRMIDRARSGADLRAYPYGVRPLREEILDEVAGEDGEPPALLTRNSYGCTVVNTGGVMFVDVDAPAPPRRWLGRLLGRQPADPALERLRDAVKAYPASSFRLYRTAGGFRVLVTDRTYDPASDEARALMEGLGADPAFVLLCRSQKSFRARLTPKPWRCGLSVPPGSHPRGPAQQAAFDAWRLHYETAIQGHATCAFVEQAGWGRVSSAVRPVLERHDRVTGAASGLPLA
jgi:hypothetical protein